MSEIEYVPGGTKVIKSVCITTDYRYETFFETKIFETETDTLKKLRKVSIPRSLETRCHTLRGITTNTSEKTLNRVLDNECDTQEAIDYRG